MKRFILSIIFLLISAVLSAAKAIPIEEVSKPYEILVDGERIYITEGPTVYIYSSKDYKFKKKFGKLGEGPQEFKLGPGQGVLDFHITPDCLKINTIGKMSFFTKDGAFIKEIRNPGGNWLQPVGDKYVGMQRLYGSRKRDTRFRIISIFDSDLKKIKEIYREEDSIQTRRNKFNPVSWSPISYRTSHDKIFIDDRQKTILVFNSNGEKLYDINIEYEQLKITDDIRQQFIKYYKEESPDWRQHWERLKTMIRFPRHLPTIKNYFVTEQKIYILTFMTKAEKSEFLVLDLKGKLLKRTFLPLVKMDLLDYHPYTVNNERLYQLIENEDTEEWELHVTDFK
jgi:hypothetical protein